MKTSIITINCIGANTTLSVWQDEFTKDSYNLKNDFTNEGIQLIIQEVKNWLFSNEFNLKKSQTVIVVSLVSSFIKPGIYAVDKQMLKIVDERYSKMPIVSQQISLANKIGKLLNTTVYAVVSGEAYLDIAKVTGHPRFSRQLFGDVLNIQTVGHLAAKQLNKRLINCSFVIVQLDKKISIASVVEGRIIDISNPDDEGPFSVKQAGGLPWGKVVDLCFQPKATNQTVKNKLLNQSGLKSYRNIYKTFVYQIAKEIGAYVTILKGKIDGIIFTGQMARSIKLVNSLTEYVNFSGEIFVYPGEYGRQELVEIGLKLLSGKNIASIYKGGV